MKLIIITAAAALISTAAIAGNSHSKDAQMSPIATAGEGFIYGGFGPYNDSR